MKPHIRNYYRHHKLAMDDWVSCRVCGATAVDIHHINGRGGGKKAKKLYDDPGNLVALCRNCHERAHGGKFSKEYLKALI